ncbi:MAG TPA: amylo-alpha-1,6-glucosidase, partial [Thermoanaerobaculia bacterium]|nr:amylo-alpha-1,6-glucosidase [Thermoanaerobaculia bacterium]
MSGWQRGDEAEALVSREWLATNGIGGYASSTIAGVCTRRYHGHLVAALPAPLGRFVMLNHVEELVRTASATCRLSGDEPKSGALRMPDVALLESFALEDGLPVWTFADGDVRIEKRLVMPYMQNTTFVQYRVLAANGPIELHLRPSMHFRPHEEDVALRPAEPYAYLATGARLEIAGVGELRLRIGLAGAAVAFERDERLIPELLYRVEQSRGYRSAGALWSPGSLVATLSTGESATLAISTEPWAAIDAIEPDEAFELERQRRTSLLTTAHIAADEDPAVAHLVLAADQFLITPQMRTSDAARRRAAGEEPRTVIAGYHWFTDWGRDTMISLEGLTLATGRLREAGGILRTFASHVRDGLIPNMFPEGENEGLYHTADATLWFFHAIGRYVRATGDRTTLGKLLPVLDEIIARQIGGTRFGIGVDPADGLLRQGAESYQLTWMDAKVDGWVVTPRRGKAVEINALFYNALRLVASWVRDDGNTARATELEEHA